ncbi:MAG: hypothetical protein CSA50_04595 [Gammaproteobacteria bacterium]|nr:MAG: hypothetical protein CSA50_04595 [Gammaproteobacteria bacterium]
MDDLRPEKDEVDRYQSQRGNKQNKTAAKTNTKSSGRGQEVPAGRQPEPQVAFAATRTNGSPKPVPREPKRKGKLGVWLLSLGLLCVAGFLGFHIWSQSQVIAKLEENLADATNYMKQSKLLMARLEGRVYQNDSELEESGSQIDKKIAFFDSEIRKLWGVAYDRNKKAIQVNANSTKLIEQNVAALSGELDKMTAELGKTGQYLKSVAADLDGTTKRMDKTVQQLDGVDKSTQALQKKITSLSELAGSLGKALDKVVAEVADLSAMQSQLVSIQSQLGAVQGDVKQNIQRVQHQAKSRQQSAKSAELKKLDARLRSIESAMDSVDGFRRTSNERVIRLERRLNEMQLTVRALDAAR